MIITAEEAKEIVRNNIRKNNDISKTQTIMRNIKSRANKGLSYFEYMAHVNYPIAKTLIEKGFKLYGKKLRENSKQLTLEDFKDGNTYYGIKIDWSEECFY